MATKKCKGCKKILDVHHGTANEHPRHPGYCYECGKKLEGKSK
jgi:hypothetical protein